MTFFGLYAFWWFAHALYTKYYVSVKLLSAYQCSLQLCVCVAMFDPHAILLSLCLLAMSFVGRWSYTPPWWTQSYLEEMRMKGPGGRELCSAKLYESPWIRFCRACRLFCWVFLFIVLLVYIKKQQVAPVMLLYFFVIIRPIINPVSHFRCIALFESKLK